MCRLKEASALHLLIIHDLNEIGEVTHVGEVRRDQPRAVRMRGGSNHQIEASCGGLSSSAMGGCRELPVTGSDHGVDG